MIERYDPFERMASVRKMMDKLLQDAFSVPRTADGSGAPAIGSMNVYKEGDNLVVETPLPGVSPDDLEIIIDGDTLTIRAQIAEEQERQDRNYLVREYRAGTVTRSITLPQSVNPDAVEARLENGVLRIVIPQASESRQRRIPVGSGTQAPPGGDQQTTGEQQPAGGEQQQAPSDQGGGSQS